jgi:folate-binding protein YgfZ
MNENWIDFLKSHGATVTSTLDVIFPVNKIAAMSSMTPVTHLALLKVVGKDATQFLQGQLTCHVNELTGKNSFFSALCNAKGRVISTLLIVKQGDGYIVILPAELVEKVTNKLKMYILRSDVHITDMSDEFCLMGLTTDDASLLPERPETVFTVSESVIKLPSSTTDHRYLLLHTIDTMCALCSELIKDDRAVFVNSSTWLYHDISAGLPWLTDESSEEYIPQMLNIDKLGGVSFTKGCYTGQEVVARTHYLGKAKRELLVAECNCAIKIGEKILNKENEQPLGKIILAQSVGETTRILVVMQSVDTELGQLVIDNSAKDKVDIIDDVMYQVD